MGKIDIDKIDKEHQRRFLDVLRELIINAELGKINIVEMQIDYNINGTEKLIITIRDNNE